MTSINFDRSESVNLLLKNVSFDLDSFLTIENLATIYNKVSFKMVKILFKKFYFEFKAFSNKSYLNIGKIKEIKKINDFKEIDKSGVNDFHKIASKIRTILDIDEFEQHIFKKITPKPVLIVIDFYIANLVRCGNRELI